LQHCYPTCSHRFLNSWTQ